MDEADEPLLEAGAVIFSAQQALFTLFNRDRFTGFGNVAYAALAHQGGFIERRPFAPSVARGVYRAAGGKQRAAARAVGIAGVAALRRPAARGRPTPFSKAYCNSNRTSDVSDCKKCRYMFMIVFTVSVPFLSG